MDKIKEKNKVKIIIFCTIIAVIIFFTFFAIYYYKTIKNGNTMISKSEEKIIEDILNMKSYNAQMNISIESNKNKTDYVVKQNESGETGNEF